MFGSVGIPVKSNLPNSGTTYQVQVINALTNGVMQSFSTTINNGQIINVNGLYSDETVRLKIMDNLSGAVALSAAVGACNTTVQEIDVTSFKKPVLKCPSPLTFSVRSNLPISERTYNGEVIKVSNNAVLQTFTTTLNNGNQIRINGLDAEQNVRLKIYDNQSTAIANSASTDACATGTQVIDVTSFRTPPDIKPGQVLITLQFPCKELDRTKLPTLELYGDSEKRVRSSGGTCPIWPMKKVNLHSVY